MSWRRFLKRRWWDDERAREIAEYLETETADNMARGMPPAEAAAAARRKFGNPGLVREEIYRMNTIGWLESTWQDLRYAARSLRRAAATTPAGATTPDRSRPDRSASPIFPAPRIAITQRSLPGLPRPSPHPLHRCDASERRKNARFAGRSASRRTR